MRKGQTTEQLDRMRAKAAEKYNNERAARFEDFDFLVSAGSSAEQAAMQLGTNPIALTRQAYRHGRHDIARLLNMAARRQRFGR